MKAPTKVTLEITSKEYTWRVFAGDEIISARTMYARSYGASATEPGDVCDDLPEYIDLAEAIQDEDDSDIMNRLQDIHGDWPSSDDDDE